MRPYQQLKENEGHVRTRMGAAFVGSRTVFRGQDLHKHLMQMSWLALYVFGITGRKPNEKEIEFMNALWVVTSYPDTRIWCNRVAALAGSTRSTKHLGVCAGNAVAEATIYGRRNSYKAVQFFIDTQRRIEQGASLETCAAEHLAAGFRFAGYGRPLNNGDERIPPIMAVARKLGMDNGPHVRLAFALDELLLKTGKPLRMNFGGLAAAFGADLGFSAESFQQFMFPAFLAGMQPCIVEAGEKPEGTLFPVSCTSIKYEGPAKRAWTSASLAP